jgi:hypothetical protein
MEDLKVRAFFYGSFIRKDVQEKGGLYDAKAEVARLNGFDIHISPHAALSRSAEHCVYGVLVDITHKQLDAMYSAPGVGVFLPQAVLVETADGRFVPALCYIPPTRENKPADREYLRKLIAAGRAWGFPEWYVAKLEAMP